MTLLDGGDISAEVAAALKAAMRQMPSPVALLSTTDPATGDHAGLAATAFLPVSLDPPSMLVCVNRSASAYPVLQTSDSYCINILGASQGDPLNCFADPGRRDERFAGEEWQRRGGVLYLAGSPASIFCRKAQMTDFGTHCILIGYVTDVVLETCDQPAMWHEGRMRALDMTPVRSAT